MSRCGGVPYNWHKTEQEQTNLSDILSCPPEFPAQRNRAELPPIFFLLLFFPFFFFFRIFKLNQFFPMLLQMSGSK